MAITSVASNRVEPSGCVSGRRPAIPLINSHNGWKYCVVLSDSVAEGNEVLFSLYEHLISLGALQPCCLGIFRASSVEP